MRLFDNAKQQLADKNPDKPRKLADLKFEPINFEVTKDKKKAELPVEKDAIDSVDEYGSDYLEPWMQDIKDKYDKLLKWFIACGIVFFKQACI